MPEAKIYFRHLGLPTNDEYRSYLCQAFFTEGKIFIKHLNIASVVSFVLLGNSFPMMQCSKYMLKGKCLLGSTSTNVQTNSVSKFRTCLVNRAIQYILLHNFVSEDIIDYRSKTTTLSLLLQNVIT